MRIWNVNQMLSHAHLIVQWWLLVCVCVMCDCCFVDSVRLVIL